MAVVQTWFGQDLQKAVKVNHIDGNLFSHNGNGNSIGVRVYNDGEPVTLTGTVSGYVITSDGSTVPCVGARSGNEATITIPPAAYQPGNAFITIFLTDGSTVTTLCAAQTTVLQARTGSQVSPGSVVTDWTQTINAAMQSVENASENLGGIIATPYASLTYPVPLGKYMYYNNGLYRCISPIETSEEFTAAHWTRVKLGDDVSDLKSAINTLTVPLAVGYYIGMTGNPTGPSDSFSISELCPFSQKDKFELFDFNNSSWKAYCYGYAFYDENKEMIPGSGNGDFDGHFSSDSVTIPQGTCYVRFSTRTQFSPNAYVVINYINGALANLKRTIDAEINGAINTIDTEINQLSDRTESAFDDISNNGFVKEFKGFDTSVEGVGSITFRAFATRYSFTGEVDKVSVYARCSGDSATINVEIAIWDGSFTSVLASKTVAVQSNSAMQWVDAVFDSPVQLSGNFYVSIKAATGNAASTPDETTPNCTAMDSGTTNTNKYISSAESTDLWSYCGNKYCLDVILYRDGRELKHHIPTIIYVGNQNGCDYTTIQDAIDSITDDSQSKPYTIIILPGNYARFKLRGINYQTPRWISLFGYDSNTTIVYDNLGDYSYPPAEIQTNGTIQGISFINMTDEEHHTQTQGRTFAYAVHIDFGSCKVKFINCKFVSNAGAAVGIGTFKDCDFTFENCTFISECDGTFGEVGHGGLFVHTGLSDNATNQSLTVRNSISYAPQQQYGARFAVISGYTGGTYNYNFQNFGAFGNNGADVSLQDPNNNLLGKYNFNNLPLLLNTV